MGYIPHNTVIDDTMICQFTNYGFDESQIRNLLRTWSLPLVKILHDPLPNTEDHSTPYLVEADIRSGGTLLPNSIKIYWNTNGSSTFNSSHMIYVGSDQYEAEIPAQPIGTTVYYYLFASADNGKSSSLPLSAPDKLFSFQVLIDTEPPEIEHTPVEMWLADFWPATIHAVITDVVGVQSATLEFNINGGTVIEQPMVNTVGNKWSGTFTGTVFQDDIVNYRIHAVDASHAQNETRLPETGWFAMNISEMVDALVLDFDKNKTSGPILYDALVDLGVPTHYLTEAPPLPELYKSIWVCLGIQPNNHILDAADDVALRDYLVSGRTMYLEGGNFWKDDPRVALWFEFGIGTEAGEAGDAGDMVGLSGSLADGMTFGYNGHNNGIDRLKTKPGSVGVIKNLTPEYLTMVSKDSSTFKTIGSSVEFGGLTGKDVTDLLISYVDFFGLETGVAPTPTPEPTATPEPSCDTLGVTISMPSHMFYAGDICNMYVTLCNTADSPVSNVPLFIILDVYGEMFFWPSFSLFDYQEIVLAPGETRIEVLPDFIWPSGVGHADGINWYAGMTNQQITDLFGDYDFWSFGWQ